MTKYIKDNKLYEVPIKLDTDKGVVYTNDKEVILSHGYTEYKRPKIAVIALILNNDRKINSETDRKILNDFTYLDHEFYLTTENQTNFANMFVARDFLTYPQKVKTKTGFMTLESKEEVQDFYLAGVYFIKQCLEEGWKKKEDEANRIREEYGKEES